MNVHLTRNFGDRKFDRVYYKPTAVSVNELRGADDLEVLKKLNKLDPNSTTEGIFYFYFNGDGSVILGPVVSNTDMKINGVRLLHGPVQLEEGKYDLQLGELHFDLYVGK